MTKNILALVGLWYILMHGPQLLKAAHLPSPAALVKLINQY